MNHEPTVTRDQTVATLEDRIIEFVYAENYQPVKPKVIAKKLGLHSVDAKKPFKKAIKRLVRRGKLSYGRSHFINRGIKKTKSNELIGTFRRTRRGGGVVLPKQDDSSQSQYSVVFVAPRNVLDASTGDLVAVRLERRGRRDGGPPQGTVVEILDRHTTRFVGTYRNVSEYGEVEVDRGVFSEPILVGDPSATAVTPGDKVVIDLVRFPTYFDSGSGVIVEVLGRKGTPGVDTLTIMREYDLPDEFPEEVLQAGREIAGAFTGEIPSDRRDLTQLPIITIDPADAKDFDDAISLEKLPSGNWRLGVHIADVAHFVAPGSVLDHEAHHRATSVYLPDQVLPMIPTTISNLVASLQPDQIRFARTVFMEYSIEGIRLDVQVFRSAIRSQRRFNYQEVDEFLGDRKSWETRLSGPIHQLLGDMHELAMVLRRRRLDAGTIELHLPETKIDLDDSGEVVGAHTVEQTESHQIIETFMLAANESVAELLSDEETAFLRRIHEAPDSKKLKDLTRFTRDLGFECESLESRFEIKRVLEAVKGQPQEHSMNFAVLRSMKKAIYSPREIGHYALSMSRYCHFTSPIRRYPDLTVHRLLDRREAKKKMPNDPNSLEVLAEHCSQRERRAEAAERELIKLKLLNLFSKKIGEHLPAVITGVEEYGLFVQVLTLPAEGLIRVAGLDDDYYHYDDQMHALIGRRKGRHFRLGDKVQVEVARVDVDRRELDFNMIGPLESPEAGDSSARRSGWKKTGQGRGHSSGPGEDRKGTKGRRRGSSRRRR